MKSNKILLSLILFGFVGATLVGQKTNEVKAEEPEYDYSFVLNNGEDYLDANEIPEVPTFDDHVFMGFYEYPGSDEQIIDATGALVSGKSLVKGNTYYARWKVNSDANSKDILCSPVEVGENGFNYWKCNDVLTTAENYGISFEAAQGTKGEADYVPAKLTLDNLYCSAQDIYTFFEFKDDIEVVIKGNCLIENTYEQCDEGAPIAFCAGWDDALRDGDGDYTNITITGYDESAYLTTNNVYSIAMGGKLDVSNLKGEVNQEDFMIMVAGFYASDVLTIKDSKIDFTYSPFDEANMYMGVLSAYNGIVVLNSELSFVCSGLDSMLNIIFCPGEITFEDSTLDFEFNIDGDPDPMSISTIIFGSMDGEDYTAELLVKNSNVTFGGDIASACSVKNATFENSTVVVNNTNGIYCANNLVITKGGTFEATKVKVEGTITIGDETLPAEVTNIDGFETSDGVTDKQELTPTSGTTFKVTFPEPQPQPTPKEEEQPCYIHFITIGLLILSLVAFILGVYILKNKLIQVVSVAVLLVGSIVISVFSKCLICFIALGVNGILGLLAIIYLIVRKEKEEEKK